jgi:hypothetical protein
MLKDAAAARHQLRGPLCVPGFWVDFCMPSKTIRRSCEVRNMQWPRQDALIRSHASAQINSEMLRCRCSDQCVCVCACVWVWVCVVCVGMFVCVCVWVCLLFVCVRVSVNIQISASAQIHAQISVQIHAQMLRSEQRCRDQCAWV